jgi:hypothetical protein
MDVFCETVITSWVIISLAVIIEDLNLYF